jgi:hypothetical protein
MHTAAGVNCDADKRSATRDWGSLSPTSRDLYRPDRAQGVRPPHHTHLVRFTSGLESRMPAASVDNLRTPGR